MLRKITALLLILALLLIPVGAEAEGTKTNKVTILMYHHLTTDPSQLNSVTITPEKFEEDVKYLVDNGYNIILPRELTAGGVPKKTVCITFDDGYKSNYELAYPILQKYNVKAEISIVVHSIENNDNFLSWDQCREMEASGLVEIGSHTYHCHNTDTKGLWRNDDGNGVQRLKNESGHSFYRRVIDDLNLSSRRIEEELGHKPVTFAYPFGTKDQYSEYTVRMLFEVTLLTGNKTADVKNNLRDLYRYGVTMDTKLSKIL